MPGELADSRVDKDVTYTAPATPRYGMPCSRPTHDGLKIATARDTCINSCSLAAYLCGTITCDEALETNR